MYYLIFVVARRIGRNLFVEKVKRLNIPKLHYSPPICNRKRGLNFFAQNIRLVQDGYLSSPFL